MGNKVDEALISTVRSVVGDEYTEMEVIRALHMANNDVTAAINIIFDTPSFKKFNFGKKSEDPNLSSRSGPRKCSNTSKSSSNDGEKSERGTNSNNGSQPTSENVETSNKDGREMGNEWWFVGTGEVVGMSTCKGRSIKPGDEVHFTFPVEKKLKPPSLGKFGRGRPVAEIVRFSSQALGEIGRIPNEWSRCLLPLVRDNKVMVEGCCKSAPKELGIMDSVVLSVSVYINSSMFRKSHKTILKVASNSSADDESIFYPLPSLLRLLGLTPFKKAEFTPGDLYMRKRRLTEESTSGILNSSLRVNNPKRFLVDEGKVESDEAISDTDLESIVGSADSSELQEMEPPSTLQCELRPYQKQALQWMTQLERVHTADDAETTMHPCWEAYHLGDKRDRVIYLNAFSGDATTEFPSTLQMARGGILADSMGLGKTIMTIALLLSCTERGGASGSQSTSQSSHENGETSNTLGKSPTPLKKGGFTGLKKFLKQKTELAPGGNLIVCPMTLLGQWKAEIEMHAHPGTLSIYLHYGQSRSKDTKVIAQNDVVLTTYGVLSSEFSAEKPEENVGLFSIRWFRVVLDEAHTIKSSKSQISVAASALIAERRWCLTGTPIQNKIEDLYSLLRFLRIDPWQSWAWWNELVQKPCEEGDERGLKLVQSILRSIMLRRTKSTTDREGRPILVLPPADVQVIYCELTEAEKDFYEALFKRSKVKFNQFVDQGRVLHNYASILELLLRLRQCCDHPFLVLSRGDTQEFSDLNKLAKHFLKSGQKAAGENHDVPSRAYVQEVVEDLRNGEQGECPICLEAFEDAVLTPCAHRLCRECLLASWKSHSSGFCPVCRKTVSKQELITAPTDSRFQIDIEKNWVESAKVTALLNELEQLRTLNSKSIVFSQWTAFLDLLQIALSRNGISFLRLDGTLNQQHREKVIKTFSEERSVLVLLVSLKAGGVGLNLTAASNAFVLDPWWNPAVEEQAVMRVHRIGQTKKVTIKRFIVKGTVEERMEAVQARKQRMIAGALTDEEVRTARIKELKMLFS
ncbi:unnamed protein product [Cuscuta campestris]|uniref:RING-type domain-containing protein n=1 Tax=Cuscuta campestris TaxID=132261 RepID=A0A484M1Y8_9ASTE|nr:unnamed protein product [Cuscuta campestris]